MEAMPLIIIALFCTWFVSRRIRKANEDVRRIIAEVRGEAPSNRG